MRKSQKLRISADQTAAGYSLQSTIGMLGKLDTKRLLSLEQQVRGRESRGGAFLGIEFLSWNKREYYYIFNNN